jgi:adenylate cyclase
MSQPEQKIATEEVRAQLASILGSPHFDASKRNRKFLSYVVEETLAGRADRIKAYSVATSVFGRDERFDPQLDSIVRIEAGRLRRSLERYYLTVGDDACMRIEIPRGSYVPVFTSPPQSQREAAGGPPAILVAAFEAEGDQSAYLSFTRGFTRTLIIALTRFSGLRVFGAENAMSHPADADPQGLRRELAVDYVLTGGTSLGSDRFEVDALLVETRSGRTVWAETFERALQPSEIIAVRNEVANLVARTLAQPYGIIQSDLGRDADGEPPETLGSYASVLRFYGYWRTFDPTVLEEVRTGLERTVASEPDYAEACACLSLLYSNAYRFGHSIAAADLDPKERALTLARRAVDRAPISSWAHYALGLARWFAGDPEGGLATLEAGRALNPNDTTILADLGQRYAMLARWDEAVRLLEESYARNPSQPGSYRVGLFLYHFAHGRYGEALAEARRVEAPQVLYGHLAVAAAAARLGRRKEATDALVAILALDPDYGKHVVADLESRSLAPELIRAVVDGLVEAGLHVTDARWSAASPQALRSG